MPKITKLCLHYAEKAVASFSCTRGGSTECCVYVYNSIQLTFRGVCCQSCSPSCCDRCSNVCAIKC